MREPIRIDDWRVCCIGARDADVATRERGDEQERKCSIVVAIYWIKEVGVSAKECWNVYEHQIWPVGREGSGEGIKSLIWQRLAIELEHTRSTNIKR